MAGAAVQFLIDHWGREHFLQRYQNWSPEASEIETLDREWAAYFQQKPQNEPKSAKQNTQDLPYWRGFNFAHEGYQVYNGYISKAARESLQKAERDRQQCCGDRTLFLHAQSPGGHLFAFCQGRGR